MLRTSRRGQVAFSIGDWSPVARPFGSRVMIGARVPRPKAAGSPRAVDFLAGEMEARVASITRRPRHQSARRRPSPKRETELVGG